MAAGAGPTAGENGSTGRFAAALVWWVVSRPAILPSCWSVPGCAGRRRTPSAALSTRRCENTAEKAQARTGNRPGLLALIDSNCKSYITGLSEINRKFFGCVRSILPDFCPVRFPPRSRMGRGLGQRKTAKIIRSKKCPKAKKNRANHVDLHGCVVC